MKTSMTVVLVALAATMVDAEPMLTEWGAKVTSANVLREYPRPQMERKNWTCLNGDWDYAITPIVDAPVRPGKWDGKIRVPFALESPLSGCNGRLLAPHEYLWYTRKITLDPKPGERILLHFGGLGHPVEGHVWRAFDQAKSLGGKHTGDWGYGGINDTKTREGLEGVYLGMMRKLGDLAEAGLGGSVYTQTTDVEIEINGLLTYDRKVLKFNPAVLKSAHQAVIDRFMKSATMK